ncbi:MAG: very short patch repair endonuclease [Verrucomicrobiota bacterium]
MSRIRGRGNKDTEVALVKLLRRHHITGWQRNQPVFGKPDFVFPKFRLAVFVDGCFWHGCPKHETKPKNNRAFWRRKLSANKARDAFVTRTLRRAGWRVLRVWEHELARKNEVRLMRRLSVFIRGKFSAASIFPLKRGNRAPGKRSDDREHQHPRHQHL